MSDAAVTVPARTKLWRLAVRSPLVVLALAFLMLTLVIAFVVAPLASDYATKIDMAMRAKPPFKLENGWLYLLGSDNLGRSLLARVALGAQTTFKLAISAVALSFVIGVTLGVWAGYRLGWQSAVIMRMADSIMSFPVLLLAMLLLYIFQAQSNTLVFVLAFSRIPLFLRVARSEVLEVRERQFVLAAKTMGVGTFWILRKHILRPILPTLLIIASMEIAFVMLSESSLSFIGLGVRSPDISWGLMVSQGTQYLSTAWWLAMVPGTAIVLTALSLNLLASWMQLYIDPQQRWRIGA